MTETNWLNQVQNQCNRNFIKNIISNNVIKRSQKLLNGFKEREGEGEVISTIAKVGNCNPWGLIGQHIHNWMAGFPRTDEVVTVTGN